MYAPISTNGKGPAEALDMKSQQFLHEQATAQAERLKKKNAL